MKILHQFKDLLREFYVNHSMPMNVYESNSKRVLISYIKSPFYLKKNVISHSNFIESKIIAKTFKELGYSVDVVDYRCKRKINYDRYTIVFGFGLPFHSALSHPGLTKICYLTGSNPNFSNLREAQRIEEFNKKNNKRLLPRREAYWPWMHAAINSDFLIVTGNDFSKSTYEKIKDNVIKISVPFIPSKNIISEKNSNGFLWFGGAGALFKGLDLTLDAFKELDEDFTLDICGPIENEKDFMEFYSDEIEKNEKIKFHGMVDVSSEKMKELLSKNKFVILPSCSEGGASSVLTCMNLGLIPIVTKECSLDLEEFGFVIEELTKDAVLKSMKIASKISEEEKCIQQKKMKSFLSRNHSEDSITIKFKKIIQEIAP
ncbi:glycosyltransferase [SAR86 cluster bacterium]|nr:glycosyltransferase [SAR86 cluster bacterium]